MVRKQTHELCRESSPRRCHECFPHVPVPAFFLRERFIKDALAMVDMFIAPSRQLRQRYIEWGLAPEKLVHEDYGRLPAGVVPDPPDAGRRRRLGFFGQMTEFKGADVLLEAMRIVQRSEPEAQLMLWGANLDMQRPPFQARIRGLLEETAATVRFNGRYLHSELPGLLADVDWVVVPSIWWENAPLVIQEAMMHRRPVICSDIGGMAERVRDGVDGLHFRVSDPHSLADTIVRAVGSPALWDELRAGIEPPHAMTDHVERISGIYRSLLARSHATAVSPA
jgi:glycosyltransferase involved in cell wall biosynthesis